MNEATLLEETIFSEAIELAPEQRSDFVERRCGSTIASAERVMALLDGYEKSSAYLETPLVFEARGLEPKLPPEHQAGDRVGRYRLLERLGEGGFGVVFLAEQEGLVQRRVAVKVIRLGLDTREFIRRFEAERQALALMDHPNIARVFDAGATDRGRPYLVMELVRGVAITTYCDECQLALPARLELFAGVCSAIQHAHQKGVIHRDLKPSNILVGLEDGRPVPKVIDFGIAKATRDPLTDETRFTQIHTLIGTPAYTSPEQMEMGARDVDTRSDIYSLGVLLYELLTGCQPFERAALQGAGFDEMRRTIREVEPPRPSVRVSALGAAQRAEIAARRNIEPGKLSSLLGSDLDWIVMRCLEKDRARRYETANGLALDIRRYLENEPVVARPPSRAYRWRKFIRRHKTGAAAASAVLGSLVAGLITAGILLVRERAARDRALVAERAESLLRQQAEEGRELESVRASRTARDLSRQFFDQGRVADGLAYLVHAARKDPGNPTIAPQLASAITSHNFLLPVGEPLPFPASVAYVGYLEQGRKIAVYCEDGTIGFIDSTTGEQVRTKLPAGLSKGGVLLAGRVVVVRGLDNVIRVIDPGSGHIQREFTFDQPLLFPMARNADDPIVLVSFADQPVVVVHAISGRLRTLPFKRLPTSKLELSANGRWLTRSEHPYRDFELWDLETGECRATRELPAALYQIAFNLDGTRLVAMHDALPGQYSGAKPFRVWSVPDAQPLTETLISGNRVVGNPPHVLTFSPDGRWLNIAIGDGQQVFDTATGAKVGPRIATGILSSPLNADRSRAVSLVGGNGSLGPFSGPMFCGTPDRPLLITGTGLEGRKELVVRDVRTGEPVLPALSHEFGIHDLRLSDDGNTLFTFDGNGSARLWDLRTGRLKAEPGFSQQIPGLVSAMSPDGRDVVLSGADGLVYRLRVGGGAAQALILPRRPPWMPVGFLPGATPRLLWLKGDRAEVLDVASGQKTSSGFRFPEPLQGGTFGRGFALRSDLRFLVGQTVRGPWQAWELDRGGIHASVTLEGASASNGKAFFSVEAEIVALIFDDQPQSVRFWNLRTGKPVGATLHHLTSISIDDTLSPAGFSADGRRFVVGSIGGVMKVWDPFAGRELSQWQPSRGRRGIEAALSADGTRVITRDSWGEAQLWDAISGRPTSPVLPETGPVEGVKFSPAGDRLLTRSIHGVARVWDGRTGAALSDPMTHPGYSIRAGAFSPDGRRVATGAADWTARIWDARTGQPVTEPMVHGSRVVDCGFSTDGRFLWTDEVGVGKELTRFCVWSVPPESGGAPAPEWLLQLATICATKKVDETAHVIDVPEVLGQLADVRRRLAALPDNAPYVEWGRWFLSESDARPIAPGFTITPQMAAKLAADLTASP